MNLSAFGRRLTSESGTRSLMDDIGKVAAAGGDIVNLGGGNPSLIPAAEMVFRVRMQALMQHDGAFERAIGAYDAPEGERGFARALAGLLRREQGWDVTERNIALTNGSQSAFVALFNLLAGPAPGREGPRAPRILLPLSPEYIGYADVGAHPRTAHRAPLDYHRARRQAVQVRSGLRGRGGPSRTSPRSACRGPPTPPATWCPTTSWPGSGPSPGPAACRSSSTTPTGFPSPGIVFGDAAPFWDENTVLCMSLSKLGLPGLRTGIVIANEELIAALGAVNAVFCLAPGSLGPALATDLVEGGEVLALARDVIRPHYAERAERAVDLLREGLEGYEVRIHKPEGAFFLWLWLPGLAITNAVLYERLKARGVIVVSGHHFFPGLEDDDWPHKHECIRISYADDWSRIERGLAVIVEEVRRARDGA